ncbi:MAG: response regulator, partial [Victivallales bacterium]|nr:response regulator [Victivallales bacterium]
QSVVVSMALFILIILSCMMWIIQSFNEQADKLLDTVNNTPNGIQSLEFEMEILKHALLKGCVIEMLIFIVALSIVLSLYSILRKREQQLAIEKSQIEDMNKAKNYFFSTVSHDIRTPLNAIIGFSQMLKTGFETEEEKNTALDSILVCSKTLLNLINDVLDISKLEAGRMEIKPEPTVCTKLVQEIVESFKISNKNSKVEIRCKLEDMPTLMLDAQRLRQITFNLVGNAMKFTKEGHVEIRTAYKKGTFRLQVEDTGQGISKEDLVRIASPYVQLGTKTSRNGGTGLGLTISRQLAIAMGGKLEVQSTLGKGSTFSITLYNVEKSNEEPQNQTSTIEKIVTKRKCHRLLIVDDQKTNLLVLKAMLKKLGDFEIVMAFNGVEAFEILKKQEGEAFDMVLTDMWMPEMSGEELIKLIRAEETFKNLPVYVITADVEATKSYNEQGFTGILLKPVTLESLKQLLE